MTIYLFIIGLIGSVIGLLSMILLWDFENRILDGKRIVTYSIENRSIDKIYSMYRKYPRRTEVIHVILIFSSIVFTSLIVFVLLKPLIALGFIAILAYLQRDSLKSIGSLIQIREKERIRGIAEGVSWFVNRQISYGMGDTEAVLERRISFLQDSNKGRARLSYRETMEILELLARQDDEVGIAAHRSIEKMKS